MAELPEHQIFHILRKGDQEPIGPYSQNEIVELLNNSDVKSSDYVYYPELSGWKPLSQVFELHQKVTHFGDEGQDPDVVTQSFNYVDNRSEPDEEIYYIAVQHMPALSLTAKVKLTTPRSIVLTNHRVCVIHQKLMGDTEMDEYPLEQVESALKKIKSNAENGQFNIVLKSGNWVEVEKIPSAQLDRLEHLAGTLLEDFRAGLA